MLYSKIYNTYFKEYDKLIAGNIKIQLKLNCQPLLVQIANNVFLKAVNLYANFVKLTNKK